MIPNPIKKSTIVAVKAGFINTTVSMKYSLFALLLVFSFSYHSDAQVRFGDNLGNHRATDTLRMQGKPVTGASLIGTDTLKAKIIADSLRVEGNTVRLTAIGMGGTNRDSLLVIDSNGLVKKYNMNSVGSAGAGVDTFFTNLTVHGTNFGKYSDGQTIPSQGKTAKQVITDAIVMSIAPLYAVPTVTLTSTPSINVEIGSKINVTLTSTYTQKDGGAAITTTYKKNGTALAGNTDNNVVVTAATAYQSTVSYGQGACKNNNLGILDCTGQISAATASSNVITYTPTYKRYAGWVSDTTGISTSGFDATIQGLTMVNELSTSKAFSFPTGAAVTPGKFMVFCYVATSGAFSDLTIAGLSSINSFNSSTRSFINAQGFAYSARIYWNTQAQTTTGYAIATN